MSYWQFSAAVEGWNRAQGAEEKPDAPSDDEFVDAMIKHGGI